MWKISIITHTFLTSLYVICDQSPWCWWCSCRRSAKNTRFHWEDDVLSLSRFNWEGRERGNDIVSATQCAFSHLTLIRIRCVEEFSLSTTYIIITFHPRRHGIPVFTTPPLLSPTIVFLDRKVGTKKNPQISLQYTTPFPRLETPLDNARSDLFRYTLVMTKRTFMIYSNVRVGAEWAKKNETEFIPNLKRVSALRPNIIFRRVTDGWISHSC